MIEYVAIDVDLRIFDRGQDLRGHEEFIRQVRFHRRHTNARGSVDQRNGRRYLPKDVHGPFEFRRVVEIRRTDDLFGALRLVDQISHPGAGTFAQGQLQLGFFLREPPVAGQSFQTIQLLGHAFQRALEKIRAEIPIVHLEVDVLLHHVMPGTAQERGQRRETQIGLGGIPIRREEQHDLLLRPAVILRCRATPFQELRADQPALIIVDPHNRQSSGPPWDARKSLSLTEAAFRRPF